MLFRQTLRFVHNLKTEISWSAVFTRRPCSSYASSGCECRWMCIHMAVSFKPNCLSCLTFLCFDGWQNWLRGFCTSVTCGYSHFRVSWVNSNFRFGDFVRRLHARGNFVSCVSLGIRSTKCKTAHFMFFKKCSFQKDQISKTWTDNGFRCFPVDSELYDFFL